MKLINQIIFILKRGLAITYVMNPSENDTQAAIQLAADFRSRKARFLEFDGNLEHLSLDFDEVAAIRLIYQEEK